jgi:TRAP-type C4-dicarboxylate transport system permease large subunit
MFNLFFDRDPWFSAKRYGWGAGFPLKWQGWALIAAYACLVTGIMMLGGIGRGTLSPVAAGGVLVATALFVFIAQRRTEGGWHWRWGGD